MKGARIFFAALAILLPISVALAEVPQTINYQGRLTNSSGDPLDTTVSMTFSIYDTPTGIVWKWRETQPSVTVTNGLFNVLFGSVHPVADSIFAGGDRWLGISVGFGQGGEPEFLPRTKLASVPYALHASTVDSASVGIVSGDLRIPGKLILGTADKQSLTASEILSPSGTLAIGKGVQDLNGNWVFDPGIKVGIGTIAPLGEFHVENGQSFFTLGTVGLTPIAAAGVSMYTSHNYRHGLAIRTENNLFGDVDHGALWIENTGDGGHTFYAADQSLPDPTPFVITKDGDVGIGTINPNYELDVNGGGHFDFVKAADGDELGLRGSVIAHGAGCTPDKMCPPAVDGVIGIMHTSYLGINGCGVRGMVHGGGGTGVLGQGPVGVYGQATGHYMLPSTSFGVYGKAMNVSPPDASYGVYSNGDAYVYGDLGVLGTISKSACNFKIDHPLDPENKYLYHSSVESPDMKNVYDGVATMDAKGEATVQLPSYFEALNRDFRYQLTCIGGFAPIYVAEEISTNVFKIAGGTTGMKVSWQVTGIRKDPFAEANPIQAEVDKPDTERGKYLHPKAYGLGEEYGIDYELRKRMEEEDKEMKQQ